MTKATVAILFSVAACATAKAPASTPPAITIAKPLDTLAFYVGNWTCKGTYFENDKEAHWDAKMIVAPELDGSWLSVQMIGPGTNRTVEHKGYDPVTKQWIHVAVGLEGSWGVVRSAGWTGTQMVFVPDDKADHTVSTFTHIDDRHYSHAVANNAEHGGERVWQKVCTKG